MIVSPYLLVGTRLGFDENDFGWCLESPIEVIIQMGQVHFFGLRSFLEPSAQLVSLPYMWEYNNETLSYALVFEFSIEEDAEVIATNFNLESCPSTC